MRSKKEQVVVTPRKGELYIGTEIECLLRGSYVEIELGRIASVYGEKGAVIYGKHDGTISQNIETDMPSVVGVELVTQPMTIDCYHNRTWKTIFERMVIPKNYAKSTLGGHVHLSRDFFSITQLYKFLKFLRTNYHYMQFVGGRSVEKNNYCKLFQKTGNSVFQVKYKMANVDRYETVNVTDFGTVELRFFASPRSATELYKNVEWCHALSHYVKEAPLFFTVKDFHKWLFSHKEKDGLYKNVVTFLTTPPVTRVWKVNEEIVQSTPSKPIEFNEDYIGCCVRCDNNIFRGDNYAETEEGYLCRDCSFWCEYCESYHSISERMTIYLAGGAEGTNGYEYICIDCSSELTDRCCYCGRRYYDSALVPRHPDDPEDELMICPSCVRLIPSDTEESTVEDTPVEDGFIDIPNEIIDESVPGCGCRACRDARNEYERRQYVESERQQYVASPPLEPPDTDTLVDLLRMYSNATITRGTSDTVTGRSASIAESIPLTDFNPWLTMPSPTWTDLSDITISSNPRTNRRNSNSN